jgi:L-asparaginase / beta-aspartyl-peptidase
MIIEHMAAGMEPEEAAQTAIELLGDRVEGEGGCIVLDREGRVGWAHSSSHMPCAWRTSAMDAPRVALKK